MELKPGYLCPPGYKQTEVGVIPEEWEVVTAAAACELVVDCKNRTPPVVAGGEFAVVRTPNVRAGKFVREDLRFTDEVSFREWTARAVPKVGDILITREAPLGEVCLVPDDLKVCLGQRMMLYRPDTTRTESVFLLYALTSTAVQSNLLRMIGGSTVGHAKVDDIRFLEFPLPALPEQRAIAGALSDVDELIGALDQLIAKKRDLKQATMQQLLTGQTRLPGFYGEWESSTLKQAAEIHTGINKSLSEMGSGTLYVTVQDLYDGTSIRIERLGRIRVSPAEIQARILSVGDIVFGKSSVKRDGIGYPSQFLGCGEPVVFSGFTYRARARQGITDATFLFYALRSGKTRRWLIDNSQASALTNINQSIADAIPITLPPLSEQTAIAAVLSDMDAELAALEQRRDKTNALKQGMMQELLTGRIRLV